MHPFVRSRKLGVQSSLTVSSNTLINQKITIAKGESLRVCDIVRSVSKPEIGKQAINLYIDPQSFAF